MKSLFKIRLQRIKNAVKHTGKKKYFLFIFFGLLILLLMGWFFLKVFGYLHHQSEFPPEFKLFLTQKMMTMFFLTMFMMMILSALVSSLNIFFLSKDLNLLFSSPIPVRSIFFWKAVEVGFSSSIMVIFFSLPAIWGYCAYFAPGIGEVLACALLFLLFIILGTLVGILIGIIIPSFFSVRKLQPVLSLASIVIISSIIIFIRLLKPEKLGDPAAIENLLEFMAGFDVKLFSYFPFYWISKGMNFVSRGDFIAFWQLAGIFLLFIGFIFAVIWVLQKKYYLSLFDKLSKSARGQRKGKWLSQGDFHTLWNKEVKTFFRSPGQWSQLLIIAAIIAIFIINLKGMPIPHPSVRNILAYLNLGMAAFVVSGLNSRFTFTSIPMENPGLVHLLASPFNRCKLYYFKLLFFGVPLCLIGFVLFFTGDFTMQLDPFIRISGSVFLVPLLPYLVILALYYSLQLSDQVPLSPQHLIVTKPGILFMLWSMVAIFASMVYFVRPLFVYYYNFFLKREIPVWEILLWFLGFIVLYILLTIPLIRSSLKTWRRKEYL